MKVLLEKCVDETYKKIDKSTLSSHKNLHPPIKFTLKKEGSSKGPDGDSYNISLNYILTDNLEDEQSLIKGTIILDDDIDPTPDYTKDIVEKLKSYSEMFSIWKRGIKHENGNNYFNVIEVKEEEQKNS